MSLNVSLDRIALELGRAILARLLAEQRAEDAERALAQQCDVLDKSETPKP
jgi:hypothetical protein